jgi:AraC-like DNA-binding protein
VRPRDGAADTQVASKATLLDVIVLRLGKERLLDRMRMLVRAIHDELKGGRLGALAVATDLASALFVQMLRVHCERVSDAGTLRLLSSLPSARAVSAMLRAPGHNWTLDALAAEAHVSRASLVRIFGKTAGVAPLAFLTDLRLGLARQRLASTEGLNSARGGRGRISIRKRLCTRLSPALQNDAWQDQGLAHHVSLFHQNKRNCRRI